MIVRQISFQLARLFVAASLLLANGLKAQYLDSSEADFFDDSPLILTASRMSKPLIESPASVSVINREMIESSGARELSEIFRLVPGFIVGNLNGNKAVVTYQGLGNEFSRQTQVLVDGRSVFLPSFGGVPWANLPLILEDIERVEIIRGPNAVTYGANAFLATINIITRHSAEDIGMRYSLTTGDNANPDVGDAYFRLGYQLDDFDWRLSVGTLNDDGFKSVNDSRESNKLNFRLDYTASNDQLWTFHIGTSNTVRGVGAPGEPNDIKRDQDATNSYLNINWEQVRSNSSTSIRLTHTKQAVVDNFPADPQTLAGTAIPITTFIDFDRDSNRTDLEFVQTEELDDSLRIVYGASLRKDRVKSLFLANDDKFHDIDTTRLFTSIEWRFGGNWIMDYGTTLEDSSITEQEYSPRFSVLNKINRNHVIRFVASRAKRNPILYEHSGLSVFDVNATVPGLGSIDFDFKTFQGNPDIKPEDIVSYEFGLRTELALNTISSDIKLFTYKITGIIEDDAFQEVHPFLSSLLGTPVEFSVDTAENAKDARVNGIELAFDWALNPNLGIKSGFSYVSLDSDSPRLEATFPDTTAFLLTRFQWLDKHIFSTSLYHIAKMAWFDGTNPTPAINKLDLRYAYMLDVASETRIELIAQNLLEEYPDYFEENINERIYLLRISGSF